MTPPAEGATRANAGPAGPGASICQKARQTRTYAFTVRLGQPAEGLVRLRDLPGADRRDDRPGNDTAPVVVRP